MTHAKIAKQSCATAAGSVHRSPKTPSAKLTIGEPGDLFERQATRVASKIVDQGRASPGEAILQTGTQHSTRHKCEGNGPDGECETCEMQEGLVQRLGDNLPARPEVPSEVHDALHSPGQPLRAGLRAFFEPRLEFDFSKVRIHSGGKSPDAARAVGANAFTVGNHIVFAGSQPANGPENRRLMAHELVHVMQQDSGTKHSAVTGQQVTWSLQRSPTESEPAMSPRDHQLACVIRMGGCPSSRDGGLPSVENITNYNQKCSNDSKYAGPDVYPTKEECANPPKEPLTTGEKIFLGALLIVAAGAATAAIIAVGAEVLPVVIASVGEASTAATAFYYANAIVVNEVGLFTAGLLIACEGNVPGLLQAMANDPAQALTLLAEIYILHVNVKIASGQTRPASVPVKIMPPGEQTDPQNIRFKSVGPPQFEEDQAPPAAGNATNSKPVSPPGPKEPKPPTNSEPGPAPRKNEAPSQPANPENQPPAQPPNGPPSRVVYPRGIGASTGPVPPGYTSVSRWIDKAEADRWIANGGTYIPPDIGGESARVYVTAPGAPQPPGTGPIRIDFSVRQEALQKAGAAGWFQIFQSVTHMPIYNVSIHYP